MIPINILFQQLTKPTPPHVAKKVLQTLALQLFLVTTLTALLCWLAL